MVTNKEFAVHILASDSAIDEAKAISYKFDDLLIWLTPLIGSGLEANIVKIKLQEAYFFARKAVYLQKSL